MIETEVQSLSPSAKVELFELDATNIGGPVERFYPGYGPDLKPIVWKGVTYNPLPIQIEGLERDGHGKQPRPTITIGNIAKAMTTVLRDNDDLLSAKVIRRSTFARFLDAVNFPDGNPDANPAFGLPDEIFKIERKVQEDRQLIQFELVTYLDLENKTLPARQIVKNTCPWGYRSAECSYAGPPVAKADDTPTTSAIEDNCGRRLSSCKLRFGENAELPTGAFPASNLIAKV